MSRNNKRQLVVIGAGPGGYAAAFKAADLGLQVTLIDRETNPGGVCLYYGCIPAKTLLHAAKVIGEADKAKEYGVVFGQPEIQVEKLRQWKDKVVARLTRGLGSLAKKRKIEYIQGMAEFIDNASLQVKRQDGEEEVIGFEQAIIATGARPATLPEIDQNAEAVWDSSDSLALTEIPKSLLVVGGGYIGLEQASIYAALGSNVTVCEMMDQLLPGEDQDLVKALHRHMEPRLTEILLKTEVSKVEESKRGMKVQFTTEDGSKSQKTFNRILVATGRKFNTEGIGLQNTGVELDDSGGVKTDHQQRTAESRIFAVGDVTGNPQFAHKATAEGVVAAKTAAGKPASFDYRAIPFVVYTDFEIAGVGLNERQAREAGWQVKVSTFPWSASGRAGTMGRNKGLTKLVTEEESGRILGLQIAGSDAGKLIAEGALALEMGAVAEDIAGTIHPHPTLSETIMEAAEEALQGSLHL